MTGRSVSPQEAATELLRRRKARQGLEAFTGYTTPRWEAGTVHRTICEQFDRIEAGEIDRLMVLLPPQHGKSSIASKRYPAYALGRDPRHDVISASAVAQLAEDFGREVRNTVASHEYRLLFPETNLAEDSQAKGRWGTQQGGSYFAVGIGGALMGRGATRAVIDDPFATWEDAQSSLARERVWEWYTGTLYNRVRAGGSIILIQHRMHEEDLAGRLIERMKSGGDKWEIVELPAIGDYGALWPERYDMDALLRIKTNTHPMKWNALYQQTPTAEEGTFFRREWFKRYRMGEEPKQLSRYGASDYAVTDAGGDFTEHGIAGFDEHEDLWLLDWWSGQKTPDIWIERQLDLVDSHDPYCWVAEGGPIRRSIEPFLKKRRSARKSYFRIEWLTSGKDKATNARSFQALAASGKVWVPRCEWGDELIEQLISFPTGKHDDKVDVCGLFGRLLDQTYGPRVAGKQEEKPKRDPYAFEEEDSNWKTA